MTSTWFITGISSGFGHQLTKRLLEQGHQVAGTLRRPEAVDDLRAIHGDRLWLAQVDITNTEALRDVIAKAFSDLGRIDAVVSNAGYLLAGAAEELSDSQIERQIATNLIASIQLARAAIPLLRRQGGGRIIQITSSLAQVAYPTMSLYSATKWGIEGFFEGVIPEIAPFGIEVTMVEPGASRTNFGGASADGGPTLDVYDNSYAGEFRRKFASAGLDAFPGDPSKVAAAIIATLQQSPAPKRLTLGSDAYHAIHQALSSRLAELEAQKATALSTDVTT